ncbi:MAG: Mut7-C RNAse domain-containing protein [Thermodesulfovibrionaceae bacterium]
MSKEDTPKFVADVMLGSLSRWLRLFGFDTLYFNNSIDKELIKISLQQNRILLTKDNALARCKLLKKVLLIKSEEIKDQIKEVLKYTGISKLFLSLPPRCPVCNGETKIIDRGEIDSEVPEYIFFTKDFYRKCKQCGKIYWYGSHMDSIEKMKEEIFNEIGLK